MNKRRKFIYWLPVLAIGGIIFWFSAQPYSKQDLKPELSNHVSSDFIHQYFSWVNFDYAGKEISLDVLTPSAFIEFFIRKGAHFSIFFLLGMFTCNAIYYTLNKRISSSVILTFLLVGVYAALDEVHQHFTGDRTPLVQDVLLDCFGAIIGIVLYAFVKSKKQKAT